MQLLYFTNSYPYGLGEQWKHNELLIFRHYFSEITVIPFSYSGNYNDPKKAPQGIRVVPPLFFEDKLEIHKFELFKIFFNSNLFIFISEFFRGKCFKSKRRLISWFAACLNIIRLINNQQLKSIIEEASEDSVLYFYWGRGTCEILPFINTLKFKKIIVRMHRYDLFLDVNNGFIPFQKQIIESTTLTASSSLIGKNHLIKAYPSLMNKIDVVRCGTKDNGKRSEASTDNVLRIVSCSLLSKVKRINLMVYASTFLKIPFVWIHIGDGTLQSELSNLVEELKLQNNFKLIGNISSEKILDYYTLNQFDLFVNVSISEGVPFSIMEALSCGLPVFATNAGGTGEIIDDDVGKLLELDVTPENLATYLTQFYTLSKSQKEHIRNNAFERYMADCNSDVLSTQFVKQLLS